MAIHSFLKVERGDPDWQFSPENYFGKEFKIIDASIVELEEGKQDQIVLRQNPTEKSLLAKHLKIHIQKDAILDMMILNDVDPKIQQVFLYDVHLKQGANINLGIFTKNGKFNKHIIQISLEEGANFTAYGIISNTCGGDTEIITKVVHQGPNSRNNQLFLGMAGRDSQTVYQSINIVEPEASNSEIATECSNLIIAPGGRCHSKPENYINADYVETIQRSDTSIINLEKVGYLQSKGIPENKARSMIKDSFTNLIYDLVVQDTLHDEIKDMYVD